MNTSAQSAFYFAASDEFMLDTIMAYNDKRRVYQKIQGNVPAEIENEANRYMREIVSETIGLMGNKSDLAQEAINHQIELIMAADYDWRPVAQSIDLQTGVNLVVIFDREAHSRANMHPELWALMTFEEETGEVDHIYHVSPDPKGILDYLQEQDGHNGLPHIYSFVNEIPYLREYRKDILAEQVAPK